ncbi:MAG TPA: cytochrome c [Gemmatimonadaceae bacterium]|nr:cytochrome c [Gemmatimonadaceae bacterium]
MKALILLSVALGACSQSESRSGVVGDSARQAIAAATPSDSPRATVLHAPFRTIGHRATSAEVRAWNIDVNPSGDGLPRGSGSYQQGAQVFAQKCASCHGPHGEGTTGNPKLVGREPRDFSFAKDPKIVKTVGNYWPYATTLYDYINRAMPFDKPGSMTPDEMYGVIAFILAENEIIDRNQVMNARTLPQVRMPSRDRFVPDDRAGGSTFR